MSTGTALEQLRPVERRVLKMRDDGIEIEEIASRIRKSPAFVTRMLAWTEIPRTGSTRSRRLTPMQRRVLDLRSEGRTREEIASSFKKGESFIRQVEGLAHFKEGIELLSR